MKGKKREGYVFDIYFPPLGQRIMKTSLAVFICLMFYWLRGYRGVEMPAEACITAIICMQPYVQDTAVYARDRFVGSFIGALWGLMFLLLLAVFPDLGKTPLILYPMMGVGVLISLYSAVVMHRPDTSGQAAIDRIAAGDKPDVILMDIVMPGMDGITATQEIRRIEAGSRTPVTIISLTAEGSDVQVDECLKAGADDCMGKPLLVSEFSKILAALRKKEEIAVSRKQLEETARNARMDVLTHARNMIAFADQVAELTGRMAGSVPPEYAVVVCNMDNTRQMNEQFGLEAGDQFLKNGYGLIADVFAHSPIYRTCGDGFLVVLETEDYKNRDLLMAALREKVEGKKEKETVAEGYLSMITGMAVYNPETDASLAEVIQRAASEAESMRQG